MATMSLRTLGKVLKMEILTKLDGVKNFKLGIFNSDFPKTKDMEPLEIKFLDF